MKIRGLDQAGDFTFGVGLQNYLKGQNAIALDLRTRLKCFLNDCFFDAGAGIDWFNLLGSKNEAALLFSLKATILGTPGINSVTALSQSVGADRSLTIHYGVTTVFGEPLAGNLDAPIIPFAGVSKFVKDILFEGQTEIDIDVSDYISNAQKAVWILYDVAEGFSPVVGAVHALDTSTVRLIISPAPAGTFRLVGIA